MSRKKSLTQTMGEMLVGGRSKRNLNRKLVRKYVGKDCFLTINSEGIEGSVVSGKEGCFFQSSRNPAEEIYKLFMKSVEGDKNCIRMDLTETVSLDYLHKPKNKRIYGELRRL